MHRVIDVDLTGQPRPFRLHDDAYETLREYLDGAHSRLGPETDANEVIDDLERSIGERLTKLAGPNDRVLAAADITSVLDEIGAVETETEAPAGAAAVPAPAWPAGSGRRSRRRRLYRIHEGQEFAGVCTGLAAYSEIDLAWIRTIFVLATIGTAGGFLLVYLVLAFVLPVVATRAEWFAITDGAYEGAS
jgi:phage shock protein PspC (stress-responsive transcriptional regulator)